MKSQASDFIVSIASLRHSKCKQHEDVVGDSKKPQAHVFNASRRLRPGTFTSKQYKIWKIVLEPIQ
ncbi:MAG: hypothetical protein D4R81_12580 [Nitrospiraceae bacterium]|jgi:hypothetical protein|nr:MAG: hypothetical protein D4R81_12580 [Nitrospiraceae bacterium]